MHLESVRIITANLPGLIEFYRQITGISPNTFQNVFAEVNTSKATLALGSTQTLQLFGGDAVAASGQNRSAIIEFMVDDVDAEFARLESFLNDSIVQKPTTMPWGNRSLLFRDPDGNLVNFFTPVTADAKRKFGL